VRFNSIQIAVPQAYCDNCIAAQGKSEEQAAIDDLDLPCPRCGSLDMLIRHPMVLEQSMVAIPAYEKAEVTPIGFKASVDRFLQKRFEPKGTSYGTLQPHKAAEKAKVVMPDLTPVLLSAFNAVESAIIGVAEIQLRMAKIQMEGYPEDPVDIHYTQKATEPPSSIDESELSDEQIREYLATITPPMEEEGILCDFCFKNQATHPVGGNDFACDVCDPPTGKGEADTVENCPNCGSAFVIQSDDGSFQCGGCGHTWNPFKEEAKGGSLEDFPLIERGKPKV
jgi:ribosomal protein S27AE